MPASPGETASPGSEIATYRRLFNEKYSELEQLLDGLPDEALLWKPFENSPWQGPSNEIGRIIAHTVSSTIYLLRRAEWILGRIEWEAVDGDEGREEFGPANHRIEYLRERVQRTHAWVDAFLDSLTPEALEAVRPHPKRPRDFTVRYDIQHAIEHMSLHIGHGQITRQLWALQAA
jgi:hypothetical protein